MFLHRLRTIDEALTDVSLRFVSICVVDEAGAVRYENKVAAEVDLIVASLRRFSADIKQVGLE
ncbi:MAG: hypothetical protein ABW034_10540, partial [Steroidobacteraceae bacterium]